LQEVRPTDGIFKGSGCGSKIHFRTQSWQTIGLFDWCRLALKVTRYGNWRVQGLDGHIAGHYLSVLSMLYAGTGTRTKNALGLYGQWVGFVKLKTAMVMWGIPNGKIFWERIHKGYWWKYFWFE
jgi:hypothetical protein